MSKLRSVNTHFWNDNYIIDLDPQDKLLFLYLLTNDLTNMLGIYELHIRKISFDTGLEREPILKAFERFHKDGKASYIEGYVCLHNFTKHQAYNDNMKKAAINSFNELPLEVRKQGFCEPILKGLEPFPKGFEPIAEIESEYESEIEYEIEEEESNEPDGSRYPEACEFVEEAEEVADYLLQAITDYEPAHRYGSNPPSMKNWVLDIERAIRLDKRKPEQLKLLIDFVFREDTETADFWKPIIQSGKNLRDKFDTIVGQARKDLKKRNGYYNQTRADQLRAKLF